MHLAKQPASKDKTMREETLWYKNKFEPQSLLTQPKRRQKVGAMLTVVWKSSDKLEMRLWNWILKVIN